MKVITLYKAVLFWIIIGHNTSVLCAGEEANEAAKPAEGAAKTSDDKRRAIILDVTVKESSQYKYIRTGYTEQFKVYQGFKIKEVKKGGVSVWTAKGGRFAKEIHINLSTKILTAVYL